MLDKEISDTQVRLGVDIGGTFTDVVLETARGRDSIKVLTTYDAPENAIIEGMHIVCRKAAIEPAQITQIIHGTTLATNALIERRGAKTALITTKGFRDVIEMRTESRFEQYDLNLTLPDPLLPRYRRYVIDERIDGKGNILKALDDKEIHALADIIEQASYESIAIGLLHSYVNPAHEQHIKRLLAERLPDVMISVSSEVSPQMREYERFNTTIANAYIKPLMKSYLSRLKTRLGDEGADCPVFLMHSGGGIISLENAAEFPVRLVESGPAGGAVFAANIAASHGLEKVLSFDMGGTTAKICLIKNHIPKTARVFEVARTYRFKKGSGMPISIPVIDMVEIGAGGGSLAHVDAMKQIRVGPQSAGSEPGPACYNRGGIQPAVTDADLILGKLDADDFAGGSITLSCEKATDALVADIGRPLSLDAQSAAFGIAEMVDENMANAARVHAVENGEDLSDYTMIAFGGAAPLHAGRLAEKLGIARTLIPQGAGVGSAIGFLRAPFSFEANRSVFMRLSEFKPEMVTRIFAEMRAEATSFVRSCDAHAPLYYDYKIYMRYAGQGWEIPVNFEEDDADKPEMTLFKDRFEEAYRSLFARTVAGLEIEITVWSVNASTKAAKTQAVPPPQRINELQTEETRPLFDPAQAKEMTAGHYQREALQDGDKLMGPAAITEAETTIIVPASCSAMALPDGCIALDKRAAKEDV